MAMANASLPVEPIKSLETPPPVEPVRSLEFYYDDGNVVFEVHTPSLHLHRDALISHTHLQVSNVLYRLHRSVLTSRLDLFGGMFLLPHPDDGLDDDHPVRIQDGVAVREDFEPLLKHIYGV